MEGGYLFYLFTDQLDVQYSKNQKKDPQTWLYNRNGKGPSTATAAMFKAESEGRALSGGSSLVHNAGRSLGPGGRKLKAVDSGRNNLFGDDDEDRDAKRRRDKEYGGEGDLDEMVYEEDFADDEEKMDVEDNDEEAREIEVNNFSLSFFLSVVVHAIIFMQERLKREYKSANKQREGYVDESDEEDSAKLTKQGEAMKKLIRNREGNDVYDSDDEKNPYASSASIRYFHSLSLSYFLVFRRRKRKRKNPLQLPLDLLSNNSLNKLILDPVPRHQNQPLLVLKMVPRPALERTLPFPLQHLVDIPSLLSGRQVPKHPR